MNLRVQILQQWNSCKTKLATVRLTPQDKEVYEFLSGSKIGTFSHYCVDSRTSLEQLEKEIRAEWDKLRLSNPENEMLFFYWSCWTNFASLILDWINLKRVVDSYRAALDEKEKKLEEQQERLVKVIQKRTSGTRDMVNSLKKAATPQLMSMRTYPGESELSIAQKRINDLSTELAELRAKINALDYVEIMDI